MRLAGLLATAALLGSGVAIGVMVMPSSGEEAVVPAAPAATPKKAAEKRRATPRKPRYTKGQRRARRAAVAVVRRAGHKAVDVGAYDPRDTLRVLVGRDRANGRRAFFFARGQFLGFDADTPSGKLRVARTRERAVTLAYGLYEPGDRRCCPRGGTARVRFRWSAEGLVPQDAIPPAAVRQPVG
jgi:hypothetical protein